MKLVKQRGPDKTICPSEAARSYADDDNWRPLMEPVRNAARSLASRDKIEILQQGETVDPENFSGLIRLRIKAGE